MVSGLSRGPHGFSVTLVYCALIAEQSVVSHIDTVEDMNWVDVDELHNFAVAFDHKALADFAWARLEQKNSTLWCLSTRFTIGQLKGVIEAIIGKSIQRKSLIRRIEASQMFDALDEKVKSGGRLAQLYKVMQSIDIAHLSGI